jgi:alpha/beta superfamily hydrolase
MYKVLKNPFFGRFMVPWKNPLTAEQQTEWTALQTQSASGGTIRALFAPATRLPAKATVVLGHPMGKAAKAYFIRHVYTDLLRQNGYNTLIFDINGFGESTHGNFDYFEDIIAAGKLAATQTPDLPIAYFGISLGGQFATIAFADPTHPFRFAIVESAATSLPAFWVHFPFAYRVLRVMNLFLPRYAQKIHMVERIKEAKHLQSLLLIYSHTDHWTPVAMGEHFQRNSPVPTELWTVSEGEHAALMQSKYKAEYAAKIIAFLDEQIV